MQYPFSLVKYFIFVVLLFLHRVLCLHSVQIDKELCGAEEFQAFSERLFSLLELHSHTHELFIHSFEQTCNFKLTNLRYMIFNSSYAKDVGVQFPHKYSQSIAVILTPVAQTFIRALRTFIGVFRSFIQLLLRSSTSYLCIHRLNLIQYNDVSVFLTLGNSFSVPSTILFVQIISTNITVTRYNWFGYCGKSVPLREIQTSVEDVLVHPLWFHKKLFSNGNQQEIKIDEKISMAHMVCNTSPRLFLRCFSKVMIIVEVLKYHNFTFAYIHSELVFNKLFQYIMPSNSYESYGESIAEWASIKTSLVFRRTTSDAVFYCSNLRPSNHWLSVSLHSWIGFISIPSAVCSVVFLVAISHIATFLNKNWTYKITLFDLSREFLGWSIASAGKRTKFLFFVSLLGMVICPNYLNEVGARVTVSIYEKPHNTLNDLVIHGFKLLWPSHYNEDPFESESLKYDFAKRNLLNYMQRSIYYNTSMQYETLLNLLSQKYAGLDNVLSPSLLVVEKKVQQKSSDGSKKCFLLSETLIRRHSYSILYSVNRHWIMQTLQHFTEGGFMQKWDDWALYAQKFEYNVQGIDFLPDKVVTTGDYLKFEHLLIIFGLTCILWLVASITLVAEFACIKLYQPVIRMPEMSVLKMTTKQTTEKPKSKARKHMVSTTPVIHKQVTKRTRIFHDAPDSSRSLPNRPFSESRQSAPSNYGATSTVSGKVEDKQQDGILTAEPSTVLHSVEVIIHPQPATSQLKTEEYHEGSPCHLLLLNSKGHPGATFTSPAQSIDFSSEVLPGRVPEGNIICSSEDPGIETLQHGGPQHQNQSPLTLYFSELANPKQYVSDATNDL